jgi:hypothetical protein
MTSIGSDSGPLCGSGWPAKAGARPTHVASIDLCIVRSQLLHPRDCPRHHLPLRRDRYLTQSQLQGEQSRCEYYPSHTHHDRRPPDALTRSLHSTTNIATPAKVVTRIVHTSTSQPRGSHPTTVSSTDSVRNSSPISPPTRPRSACPPG